MLNFSSGVAHIYTPSYGLFIDAPILTKDTKNKYLTYIEHIVKAQLPDRENEQELYELVKTYQIHSHSKSCHKYKNIDCRYSFGRCFTESTVIAEPLPDDMCDDEKQEILQNRANILTIYIYS